MKRHFKYSAIIEKFLTNDLAYAEKKSFEKEVTTNKELSEELILTKSIDAAISNEDILDLRIKLLAARKEAGLTQSAKPKVRTLWKKYWYAAASIILLATVGSVFIFAFNDTGTNDSLFKQYYSPDNLIQITRSSDANIVEAIIKFQERDYTSASRLFGQILENDTTNFAGWFYYGISCIETSDYLKAENAFNRIIQNEGNLYSEHAEWYLGLSFLKSNQMVKAKMQLEKIAANPDNFHRKDARHLLKQINKN
ncbi:MAG: hypothetical protein IPH84_02405 [Bacteroidales bacterium]|nr:hypothetical protein [Bacteroidales bacterium]